MPTDLKTYQNIQCCSNPMGDKPSGCTMATEQLT